MKTDISFIKTHDFFKKKYIKNIMLVKNQGLCNTNYIVKTKKQSYVLRFFHSNKSVNISREFEYKVQKEAFRKNLTAKPYYFDKKNGLLISNYLKGKHKNKLKSKELKTLIKKVKKVHKLKMKSKTYDFNIDLNHYKNSLHDKKSQKLIKKLKKKLKKLRNFKKNLALCHHDLNPKNIIFSDKNIYLIDWEYAGINDIFFDLATICIEFNLDKRKKKILLKQYFKNLKYSHFQKLKCYEKIYSLLCKLWFKENL